MDEIFLWLQDRLTKIVKFLWFLPWFSLLKKVHLKVNFKAHFVKSGQWDRSHYGPSPPIHMTHQGHKMGFRALTPTTDERKWEKAKKVHGSIPTSHNLHLWIRPCNRHCQVIHWVVLLSFFIYIYVYIIVLVVVIIITIVVLVAVSIIRWLTRCIKFDLFHTGSNTG